MASIAPARMRSTTTALSTRSPRNLGKTMPRLTAPTWWPARPMRWRPDATELGAGQLLTGQLVEVGAEPLGQAAGVGEHDRGAVGPDQLDQPLVDVGPDRGPVGQPRGRPGRRVVGGLADGRHVLDRDDHGEVEGLLRWRGDHRDRTG